MSEKVYMHFDELDDGSCIWLTPMPSGETLQIPAKKSGSTGIIDSTMKDFIAERNQEGLDVEVLQFASCSTVFSADRKVTEYEFGRPVVRR